MIVVKIENSQPPWQAVAAFTCFLGAVLSLAAGVVLTTRWLLDEASHPRLHAVGLTLLIVAIPILVLGGHFLDLLEKHNDRARRSRDY